MPTVTFLIYEGPDGAEPLTRAATAAVGTSLLDAATGAGVVIAAPCGGQGACGQCRVRVESGSVEQVARGCLSSGELNDGWISACGARLVGDVTIEVPPVEAPGGERIVTDAARCRRTDDAQAEAGASQPYVVKRLIQVDDPASDDSFSDLERFTRAVRADVGVDGVVVDLHVLRELAGALRAKDHRVTAAIAPAGDSTAVEVVRVEPGDTTGCQIGLAIDVGTTTCAVSLVDVDRNRIVGTAADTNAQLARGADVISRINYAATPERIAELSRIVLDTVNTLVARLCDTHDTAAVEINSAAVAGNTTMIHLLLGMDPQFIRIEPYTPTVNRPPRLRAKEVGLGMNPAGYVLFAPGVGSYVGGDITAGLLGTALATETDEIRLYLDIGTNGEVVVGTGEWLMTCAASAGPAFEGSGVSCGMRAGDGAIERVRIDPHSGRADVTVIGGGRPRGVCGSGMVDLLAELWKAGLLDSSGRFDPTRGRGSVRAAGRRPAYTIVPASRSDSGEAITITESDVQNLLRTKAAVYSACSIMLKAVDLDFDAVTEVYVAGGFGRFLDLRQCITIGLLPDLPLERFTYLGNAALTGARCILCESEARVNVAALADRMTYLELNTDPAYMSEYTAALFLPHTDVNRFPSVERASTRDELTRAVSVDERTTPGPRDGASP